MTAYGIGRFSFITLAWGAFIVVSASFMLQVNLWLTAKVGDPFLEKCFWVAAIAVIAASVIHVFRTRQGLLRILVMASIFVAAYMLGDMQRYFAEKTHILTYGLLGYLASRDTAAVSSGMRWNGALAALAYVTIISALDEGLQWMLPYRFGEVGDFLTNVAAGALGACLFLAIRRA